MIKLLEYLKAKPTRRPLQRRKFFTAIMRKKTPFIALILMLCIIYFFIFENKHWIFLKTEYVGIETLEKENLDEQLSKYLGRSIFFIPVKKLEKILKENNIEIKKIDAKKILKDKIIFYIEEKKPVFVYVNLNSAYIFDEDANILVQKIFEEKVQLSQKDYDIVRQLINPDSDIVEDRITSNMTPEQLDDFNFEEYDFSKKQKIIAELEQETYSYFDSIFNKRLLEIEEYDPKIYRVIAWEEKIYDQQNRFDELEFNFLKEAIEKFTIRIEENPKSIIWDGEIRLIFELQTGTKIAMSPSRDIELQLSDLEIIKSDLYEEFDSIRLIDLSVEKILIEK